MQNKKLSLPAKGRYRTAARGYKIVAGDIAVFEF
jgi:hypothetical protein